LRVEWLEDRRLLANSPPVALSDSYTTNGRALFADSPGTSSPPVNPVYSFDTGNFLAISGSGKLTEYAPSGAAVRTIQLPGFSTDQSRDFAFDRLGRIHFYDGTYTSKLVTFDPVSGTSSQHAFAGWGTIANATYGGLATYGDYVFVTDTTHSSSTTNGIVRFNIHDYSAASFASGVNAIDVTVGLDGLLYVLSNTGSAPGRLVSVFDPVTMEFKRSFSTPSSGYGNIAVDWNGNIFALDFLGSTIFHLNSTGQVLNSLVVPGNDYLQDLNLAPDGRLLATSAYHDFVLTDTNFSTYKLIDQAAGTDSFPFATFVPFPVNGVLANDSDVDGNPLMASLVSGPSGGTLALASDGTFLYKPNAGFVGADSFTYRTSDGTLVSAPATVTIQVNNSLPTISPFSATSVNEDSIANVNFNVFDAETAAGNLTITVTSSDTTLVPNANLILGGSNSARTLRIAPVANRSGTTDLTVTVTDAYGGVSTRVVPFTVLSVNDAPVFTKGANLQLNEDAGAQSVTGWATGISAGPLEAAQTLTFNVSASGTVLFSVLPTITADGTLSFTPAPDAFGTSNVTVTLGDNGGTTNGGVNTSAAQVFTITINSVNDRPTFTIPPSQAVAPNTGSRTFSLWVTNLNPGPSNESAQSLSFQVSNDNSSLFATPPAISPDGTLTYTLNSGVMGTANVSVIVKDSGGTANGGLDTALQQSFTITVAPVNEAPSFTAGPNQTVNEDAGPQTVANWATNLSTGPGALDVGQTLDFQVSHDNPSLFSTPPAVSPSGVLTYEPAPDANGAATVTVTLRDNGGTAGGGLDSSAAQIFTITVNRVNDAPRFAKGPDQTVTEDSGSVSIASWATDISAGHANESGQTLMYFVTSDNPALFSTQPAVSSSGTLTFTLAAHAVGTTVVTLFLTDLSGIALGGVEQSPVQSFRITIQPENDAPTGLAQYALVGADLPAKLTLIGDDGDPEVLQSLTFAIATSPTHGMLSNFDPLTGRVTYTPDAGYRGADSFTFQVTDDATAGGAARTSVAGAVSINVSSHVTGSWFVPIANRRDHIFDPKRSLLYVTTGAGAVERLDLTTQTRLPAWNVTTSLTSIDIRTDASAIYLADSQSGATQGFARKLNLDTGGVSTLTYDRDDLEIGVWDVVVGPQNNGFVTTRFDGSGWNWLRQFASNDDTLTERDLKPGTGAIRQNTTLARGADRSVFLLVEGDSTTGPIHLYDAVTDQFLVQKNTFGVADHFAIGVNRNGTMVAIESNSGISLLDRSLNQVGTISGMIGGFAFDPLRDRLYVIDATGNALVAFNTTTRVELFRVPLGEDMQASTAFDQGVMSVSDDGQYVAISTPSGVRIVGLPVSQVPAAKPDKFTMVRDSMLTVIAAHGTLANDLNSHASPMAVALKAPTSHGFLSLNANGSFTYIPNPGFIGQDTFTYQVSSGSALGNTAFVTIDVMSAVNRAPITEADYFVAAAGQSLAVPGAGVLQNDFDADGQTLTARVVEGPQHGTLTLNSQGGFTYVPDIGYQGPDTFRYVASDGMADSVPVAVTLNVSPMNPGLLIPLLRRRDHVFDPERNLLYVTTNAGTLERYSPAAKSVLSYDVLSSSLYGLDITPDWKYVYIADGIGAASEGIVQKVNLASGQVTELRYTLDFGERNSYDVQIGPGNQGFLTTEFSGSGWNPFRTLFTDTDTFEIRSNVPNFPGEVRQRTRIQRAADRSEFYFTEPTSTAGDVFTYDPTTDRFGITWSTLKAQNSVLSAVNRNGTLIATEFESVASVMDNQLKGVVNLPGLGGGLGFDPVRNVFYGANATTDELIAYSTVDWRELWRRPIGEDLETSTNFGSGEITVSNDGRYLYLSTGAGIREFDLGAVARPTAHDDSYSVERNDTLTASLARNLLANDTSANSAELTANVVQGPQFGVLNLNPDGTFSYVPNAGYFGPDSFTYRVADGTMDSATATVSMSVLDKEPLQVSQFTPTATGFVATFTRDLDLDVLNLDDQTDSFGSADLIVAGATTGKVAGTVVVDDSLRQLTFVRTGGVLEPDTYTVRFRSAADAFVTVDGALLKGNTAGPAGRDQVNNFTIAALPVDAVTLTVPDFARASGQSVILPGSSGLGIPVALSRGVGIGSVEFVLRYDPALLTITTATLGAGVQGTLSFSATTPGRLVISVDSPDQLSNLPGPINLLNLTAQIPPSAGYGDQHVLDVDQLHVYDDATSPAELPARDDDAVHQAAYFGDADGSQAYNAADAALVQGLLVGDLSGFKAFPLADPMLVADITGNGVLQANDVSLLRRVIAGMTAPQIPELPSPSTQQFAPASMAIAAPAQGPAAVEEQPEIVFVEVPEPNDFDADDLSIALDMARASASSASANDGSSQAGRSARFGEARALVTDRLRDVQPVLEQITDRVRNRIHSAKSRRALDAVLSALDDWLD